MLAEVGMHNSRGGQPRAKGPMKYLMQLAGSSLKNVAHSQLFNFPFLNQFEF